MKNGQTLRLLFEIPPVRVGFGYMAAEDNFFFSLFGAYKDR